jgi:membrane protein
MSTPPSAARQDARGLLPRIDDFQRRHIVAGLLFAVCKKYSQDDGIRLAALLTYYGFLGFFPMLLLLVVLVTELLRSRPALAERLIDQLVAPRLQTEVQEALAQLPSGGLPLLVGVLGLLFTGFGSLLAAYWALNQIWAVPHRQRFGFASRYARVLLLLLFLLVGSVTAAALGLLAGSLLELDATQRLGSAAGSFAVAFGMLVAANKVLTARHLTIRDIWPGAALGAAATTIIIVFGAQVLGRLVARSGLVYGSFATVVGVFTLFYFISQALVFSAELSTVLAWRLFPRGMDNAHLTESDKRAMELLGHTAERLPEQRIFVDFGAAPAPAAGRTPGKGYHV